MWGVIYRIQDWFQERSDRNQMIRNFNKSAKVAFITGDAPTLLEAKISIGNSSYRHAFSKMYSGFRITAMDGGGMGKLQLTEVARVVLADEGLVRALVTNGFDTLEVHGLYGSLGYQWELKDFANIGGLLE